jgi:endonuclease YncB( thermonuclease family)
MSRPSDFVRILWLVSLYALIVLILPAGLFAYQLAGETPGQAPVPAAAPAVVRPVDPGPPSAWPSHRYVATVAPEQVHDGDTFTCLIHTDFGPLEGRIRIAGFDAYEVTGPTRALGEQARAALVQFLAGRGQPVYLEVLTTRTGSPMRSFERIVAWVWVERDGKLVDVAVLMVAAGHGVPLPPTGKP